MEQRYRLDLIKYSKKKYAKTTINIQIDIDGDVISDEAITKQSTHIESEESDLNFYVTDLKDISNEFDDFSFFKLNSNK